MLRRKLIINVIIIFVCGAVALSLPVFVKHWQSAPTATASDNNNNYHLVSNVLELAKDANIRVCCEGVEKKEPHYTVGGNAN